MPYDPGISYRGDQYMYQGITGAAGAIAGGISDWQKKHAETMQKLNEANMLFDHAASKGYVSPEEMAKFAAGSAQQKADMGGVLAKTMVMDQQAKEAELQRENVLEAARIAASSRAGAAPVMTADQLAAAQNAAWQAGKAFVQTSPHGGVVTDYATADKDQENIDPSTLKQELVPGSGDDPVKNPAQYVTTYADKQGNRKILKNAAIQGGTGRGDPTLAMMMMLNPDLAKKLYPPPTPTATPDGTVAPPQVKATPKASTPGQAIDPATAQSIYAEVSTPNMTPAQKIAAAKAKAQELGYTGF